MAQIHRNFKKCPTGGLPAAPSLLGCASHSPEPPPPSTSFETTIPCVADMGLIKFENTVRALFTVRRQIEMITFLTLPKHPTPERMPAVCQIREEQAKQARKPQF
jgi:hypothetical protein